MLLAWSKFFPSALQHLPEEEGQGKGLQAEILVVWQQSGSAAVLLASPCCQNIHTLLFAPPRTILPSPSKQGGRQDFRTGVAQDRGITQHTWRKATVFCFYCTSWLRSPALSNGLQSEMLLKFKPRICCHVPGSRRGGCVVVWLVLIHIFKLYLS